MSPSGQSPYQLSCPPRRNLPIADARHGRRLDAAVVEEDVVEEDVVEEDQRMMWPTTQGVLSSKTYGMGDAQP
jgi:hypothetical protein